MILVWSVPRQLTYNQHHIKMIVFFYTQLLMKAITLHPVCYKSTEEVEKLQTSRKCLF